jgi:hypothetical protein
VRLNDSADGRVYTPTGARTYAARVAFAKNPIDWKDPLNEAWVLG